MNQQASVTLDHAAILIDLPAPEAEVLPGVRWGYIEAFPTPAYWLYQVIARRLLNQPIRYRLGENLREEVAACLLGGHGIPARVGLAAFEHLKRLGSLEGEV